MLYSRGVIYNHYLKKKNLTDNSMKRRTLLKVIVLGDSGWVPLSLSLSLSFSVCLFLYNCRNKMVVLNFSGGWEDLLDESVSFEILQFASFARLIFSSRSCDSNVA